MQQYIQDYLASKGITKDSSASFDYDSLHDLISGYTPPPSSHQGEVFKDSGIWNEAIEAGRKYQSQVGRLGGDKETCIAVYADGYIDGQLSQPAPPTPVEGQWHLKSHNNSEDDDTVWMTDGKLSIYIDEFNFGDFPEADYWLVNFLNKYQFKLSFDDQSPLIISHLEEQVKELQGRKGLRWILAEKDNLPQGRYADFQWRYADTKAPILISQFYPADYGKYEYLSDSPAPEQVDVIDAYKEYIQLLTDELSELAGMAAVHGWKSTRHEKGVELRNKIESLQNKQA